MSESKQPEEKAPKAEAEGWSPPAAKETTHTLPLASGPCEYRAVVDWVTLHEDDKPHAAMFHTAYFRTDVGDEPRPLTFFFNGGPGAASAFLHIGAVGPVRVVFGEGGAAPAPPVQLVDNLESWLPFTDLVFVDPVGTGFSRLIGTDDSTTEAKEATAKFWEVQRDLDALSEFVMRFMTKHKRWTSPIFVAGESYGGFRGACLAKHLQEEWGIALNGIYLISPAIELSSLIPSDYSVLAYCDMFPSLVASAHHHERVRAPFANLPLPDLLEKAEAFASDELLALLVQGEAMPLDKRAPLLQSMAAMTGLSDEFLTRCQGRILMEDFTRELLRDQRKVCALHDAALTLSDPFPSRPKGEGPDPAISASWWVYISGINALLRQRLDVETDQQYRLFHLPANTGWKDSTRKHFVENSKGAMEEVRYGMALNPFMKVMIVHGIHDLVTPYFSSQRLLNHMQLSESLRENIECKTYHGGHMFYGWDASRIAFLNDAHQFYQDAQGQAS